MKMSINCDNISCSTEKDLKFHELLLKNEYSLNAVNNYGDSLLHVSAAYGCTVSVKTILDQNKNCDNIDRKNKFGWTPLMHAIRANNIETVKILLRYGADVTQRTYLGISTLTLAAGIGLEMFEIIYKACPAMLESSIHDDITPLCVAAMKNDKNLFFTLIKLGLEPANESTYTHLVLRESLFPEIRDLAKPQKDIEDYWNKKPNNIPIIDKDSYSNVGDRSDVPSSIETKSARNSIPSISVNSPKEAARNLISKSLNSRRDSKLPNLDLLSLKEAYLRDSQSISPDLIYNLDSWFTKSPNISNPLNTRPQKIMPNNKSEDKFSLPNRQTQLNNIFVFENGEKNHRTMLESSEHTTDIQKIDHNTSFTFIPEFSPSKSPCLPSDFEDEDVCGEDTPTPPHYKTPPQGMVLNSEQTKLVIVLKQFDLAHHISRFLAEEIDMNLFLTLTDEDLKEIGIANEKEREALLQVIDAYTKHEKH